MLSRELLALFYFGFGESASVNTEELYTLIAFLSTVVGLYAAFHGKVTKQENRLTKLESFVDRNADTLRQHQSRLDNHDNENRVMLALIEKVDALKEDILEIKQKLK